MIEWCNLIWIEDVVPHVVTTSEKIVMHNKWHVTLLLSYYKTIQCGSDRNCHVLFVTRVIGYRYHISRADTVLNCMKCIAVHPEIKKCADLAEIFCAMYYSNMQTMYK